MSKDAMCAAAPQPAQQEPVRVPVTDSTYNYAKSLAEAIFKQHFASDEHYSSGRIVWGVNDTAIGILTQIDNMVADMVRKPAQQEPVAWMYPDDYERMTTSETFCTVYSVEVGSATRGETTVALYTSPPAQRPWAGLTDEEVKECFESVPTQDCQNYEHWRSLCARNIEAKLKEKNT